MNTKIYLFSFVISLVLVSGIYSQEEIMFLGHEMGVGARAIGMGGAFVGIADDYSAIYWNPAGLGQIRRYEVNTGFSHNKLFNSTQFFDNKSAVQAGYSRLNSIGIVLPMPTYQGSMVFAVGYHKVRDFDNVMELGAVNPNYAAFQDLVVPTYGQEWTTDITGDLYQQETVDESGSRNHFSLAGSIELQENFWFGASVNFVSGKSNYHLDLAEYDDDNIYSYYNENEKIMSDLDFWTYDQSIISDFKAAQIKLGVMYQVGRAMRLGATVTPPTRYTVKERWSETQKEFYDGFEVPEILANGGEVSYEYSEPFIFSAGGSLKLLNVLLSGTVEFQDWAQVRFLTEPSVSWISKDELNWRLSRDLRSVTRFRLGAEMAIPLLPAKVRAGYFNDPSAYRFLQHKPNKHFVTAGTSLLLGRQVMVDLAYIYGGWQEETSDDLTMATALEDKEYKKFVGTLSVRF
ncbi:hypothetical protein JW935_19740 [candidate division KSB1 bacterium]|nr:hypothetical protein [candidate division KSB1 bacterium]